MKKTGIFVVLITVFFASCSNDSGKDSSYYDNLDISGITWRTMGGGEIDFSITQDGDTFNIEVDSYQYDPKDDTIFLTKTDRNEYTLATKLFTKEYKLDQFESQGTDVPTGSWTNIYIQYTTGEVQDIPRNISFDIYNLDMLYDYVTANIAP